MGTAKSTNSKTQSAKAGGAKATSSTSSSAIPTLDIRKLLEKLKLPGVDVQALIDSSRKDLETLKAANEQAYVGYQALTRRQGEILAEAMQEWQAGAQQLLSAKGAPELANITSSRAQHAFGQALANMREMAEMAARSHEQVIGIVNKRVHEGLDGIREQLNKRS
jgi:phasin family protein